MNNYKISQYDTIAQQVPVKINNYNNYIIHYMKSTSQQFNTSHCVTLQPQTNCTILNVLLCQQLQILDTIQFINTEVQGKSEENHIHVQLIIFGMLLIILHKKLEYNAEIYNSNNIFQKNRILNRKIYLININIIFCTSFHYKCFWLLIWHTCELQKVQK